MDEKTAYDILVQATAALNANRETHVKIQQALNVFLALLNKEEVKGTEVTEATKE